MNERHLGNIREWSDDQLRDTLQNHSSLIKRNTPIDNNGVGFWDDTDDWFQESVELAHAVQEWIRREPSGPPAFLTEALNQGKGVYKP